jgi:predicted nucleotidyltransferase
MIKNKELIYEAFFETREDRLYYSQLKDITNLSHSSLQTVLRRLKENNEIKEEKTKGNNFYSLLNKYKAIEFTRIIIDKINNLNLNVRVPVKELIKLIPKNIYTCIFFGSASRKQEKENSDLDFLVVLDKFNNGQLDLLYSIELKKKINAIKEELNLRSLYHFSIIYTNKEEFDLQKDYLVQQATETGFPIVNQLNYYRKK